MIIWTNIAWDWVGRYVYPSICLYIYQQYKLTSLDLFIHLSFYLYVYFSIYLSFDLYYFSYIYIYPSTCPYIYIEIHNYQRPHGGAARDRWWELKKYECGRLWRHENKWTRDKATSACPTTLLITILLILNTFHFLCNWGVNERKQSGPGILVVDFH